MAMYLGSKRCRLMLNDTEYIIEHMQKTRTYYVSLGDSIAVGHSIDENWEDDYGYDAQYGVNGNASTVVVPNSYTHLIHNELSNIYGKDKVITTSFARSGDTVADLMEKLSHDIVQEAIKKANFVTICIGANDVLEPAMSHLEEYINTGDLSIIAEIVENNLTILNTDSDANSYTSLFNTLSKINPDAQYVFTTVYNPYKYLWIEDGHYGFFGPLLQSIPDIEILGFDIDSLIKDSLLNVPIVQQLFDRVNGLNDWSEQYVTSLNYVLSNKINAYGKSNFRLADTKSVYDPVPDRPISAPKHYNDLVSVEYTRDYDTATMDWGRLWEDSNATSFWIGLATKYVSLSGLDISGFAADLIEQVVDKVIVPDIDPHPETYGQYALKESFVDALGWKALPRRTITFVSNGGSGTMNNQVVVALDNMTAYATINYNAFIPSTGYYFTGWNTKADGSGASYSNGQFIGLTSDITLYAQWSNIYAVTYKHTNHTNLYGSDETGHKECYALYINGELKPKFGTFANGSETTYYIPYGSTIRVVVSNYNPTEFTYDDVDCDVYFNGANVASGYRGTEYTFSLTTHTTIDFRWKIAGSIVNFNMRSWEDCYITT